MILAATEAITGGGGRHQPRGSNEREFERCFRILPMLIFREEPERATAAISCARSVRPAPRNEARSDGGSRKKWFVASYAELDDGDKELSRQIASIMFPGILCQGPGGAAAS